MPRHAHIVITEPGDQLDYISPREGRGRFSFPARERRPHAAHLLAEIQQAQNDARIAAEDTGHVVRNICLEVISDADYQLKLESLEDVRLGIQLRSVKRLDNRIHATIYVPEGKLAAFVRKIERYRNEDTTPRTPTGTPRPKNEDLVAGMGDIRFPVLRSFWTDADNLYPQAANERIWWEAWVQIGRGETADAVFADFVTATADAEFRLSSHVVKFPERLVFLVWGSAEQWTQVFIPVLDRLAELRRAKEVPTGFLDMAPYEQAEYAQDLALRLQVPGTTAPSVCILDFGVHRAHPLLAGVLSEQDALSLDPEWGPVDATERHGTEMAGLAVFGDQLVDYLHNREPFPIAHRLESVRMFRSGHAHDPDAWGAVTQESLAKAEIQAPRRARVACLAATANDRGRDKGRPSSWSGAIDEHASGALDDVRRLYVVAAGNLREELNDPTYVYPGTNILTASIEDPGQSWNALTVGACTHRVHIQSEVYEGHEPLARSGGLCPTSRTSCAWDENVWPIKPDIVMEGGNYVRIPGGGIDRCDDLSLLTTTVDATGRLLTWMSDTSAATAQAARMAAILMADYPNLWPETIRGLMVHSAEWTDEMYGQIPGMGQEARHKRLRCFGMGVPNLDRARYTVENCVSLVHQGEFQPYRLDGSTVKTNKFVLHSLPWPRAGLQALHHRDVTVRITLSYFVEPSPAGRGWGRKFRYASHGLRFALRGPVESDGEFRRRVSRTEWDEDDERPQTTDPIGWAIGSQLRTRGSIHSDWWTGPAADVATCGDVAVFPVTGWWRERKHLGCAEKQSRYALIITLSTEETDVDLYTPIAQEIGVITEVDA